MAKSYSRLRNSSRKPLACSHSSDEIRYLLRTEEHILRAISARAPISDILNEVCVAIDCQIGNIVSLISLPGDDAESIVDVAQKAALFGLHAFCSEGIVTENNEVLGSLEMYCSVPRIPSANEVELIERAKCLVAIAIQRDLQASRNANGFAPEDQLGRQNTRTGPVYLN
jgi:hypothetical protein